MPQSKIYLTGFQALHNTLTTQAMLYAIFICCMTEDITKFYPSLRVGRLVGNNHEFQNKIFFNLWSANRFLTP